MPRISNSRNRLRTSSGRMKLIAPLLDFAAKHELREWESLLRAVAPHSPVSTATLRRWLARYLKSGVLGLENKPRSDAGASRAFRNRWRAMVIVAEMHADGKPVCDIHRAIVKAWPTISHNCRPPSYNAVRRYIYSIFPPKVKP